MHEIHVLHVSKLEEIHKLAFWDALVIEAALRSSATKLPSEDLHDGRHVGDLLIENPFRDL